MGRIARVVVRLVVILVASAVGPSAHAQQQPKRIEIPAGVLAALNSGNDEYKAGDVEAFAVDLNQDGTPEVAVIGRRGTDLCSVSGNCSFWIFEKKADEYVELVRHHREHDGDVLDREVARWEVLPARTAGYYELRFYFADTPYTGTATQYRMHDGKYEYVARSCAALTYGYFDGNDTFHAYDPPKSKPCEE